MHEGAALQPLEGRGRVVEPRIGPGRRRATSQPARQNRGRRRLPPRDEVDGRVDEFVEVRAQIGQRPRRARRGELGEGRVDACPECVIICGRHDPDDTVEACPTSITPSPRTCAPSDRASRSSSSRRRTTRAKRCCGSTISELEPLEPTFVSVTYGAGGTSQERTVRITARIAEQTSHAGRSATSRWSAQSKGEIESRAQAVRRRRHRPRAGAARRPEGRPARAVGAAPRRHELRDRPRRARRRPRRVLHRRRRVPRGPSRRREHRARRRGAGRQGRGRRRVRDHPAVLPGRPTTSPSSTGCARSTATSRSSRASCRS